MTPFPSFPESVDNTMRSTFVLCQQKFFNEFCLSITGLTPSIHLHAGGAFASAIEVCKRSFYEQHKSVEESLRDGLEALIRFYGPVKAPETKTGDKSVENVIRAFDSYFQRYALGRDVLVPHIAANGKAMLEFNFAVPTSVMHPETGNPILYSGRADAINRYGKSLMVSDEKTASALGEQWSNKWTLDSQFTGYVMAALKFGYPVAGVVVRGVGLLKRSITHAEAIVYRDSRLIDLWWDQIQGEIEDMVAAWKRRKFRYALHRDVCGAYGGCPYTVLCQKPEGEARERVINVYFRKRVWDPLAKDHGEKLLENPELAEQVQDIDIRIPGL